MLTDPGQRGVRAFAVPGALEAAATSLARARRVLIVTGFPVLASGGGETDGPPGAVTLAQALTSIGVEAIVVTCPTCAPLLSALDPPALEVVALPPGTPAAERARIAAETLTRLDPSHVVAIERPGRGADGGYRDMRGRPLDPLIHGLDELLLQAGDRVTVAVGDGGNEAGLGAVRAAVEAHVRHGPQVACVVSADHVVVSGVSTWGAYGLCAGLALVHGGPPHLPSGDELDAQLFALIDAGAVDGVTGNPDPTLDGLPHAANLELLAGLRADLADLRSKGDPT